MNTSMQSQQRSHKRWPIAGLLIFSLLSVSIVKAAEWVQWRVEEGGNGHFYAVVHVSDGISWPDANAEARRENPFSHLATITSEEENYFITELLRQSLTLEFQQTFGGSWIGGYSGTRSRKRCGWLEVGHPGAICVHQLGTRGT